MNSHQHQQQQYQQPGTYPLPQQWTLATTAMSLSSQRLAPGIWWSRMSLRVLTVAFDVAVIALSAFYNQQWTIGPLIMLGPPVVVSGLWCCVDVLLLCVRSDRHGIHPTACLIVDFVLLLALGALSGVIAFTLSRFHDSGYYFAFFDNGAGEEYLRIILAFGILATVFHAAMLFAAYIQTRMRRISGPTQPQIVYVPTNNVQAQHPRHLGAPPPSYECSNYTPTTNPSTHEMPAREQIQISEVQGASHRELPEKKIFP
ncbi:hypothetical protein NQ176_g8556 [Zarea fungicola]|uniref:Uncharacterized protein n=1 Tax=Zarea fungicola TaxID=93591 RepID=A0ACC1MS40_9HYPO|nr:hypothetical protein NQ176_g8556 [Lecanicillium fungicola]